MDKMAEVLNISYFVSMFSRDKSSAPTGSTKIYLCESGYTCSELILDTSVVSKAIFRLEDDKSMAPDGPSPKSLIETQALIAYPLLLLINKSLAVSSVLQDCKKLTLSLHPYSSRVTEIE